MAAAVVEEGRCMSTGKYLGPALVIPFLLRENDNMRFIYHGSIGRKLLVSTTCALVFDSPSQILLACLLIALVNPAIRPLLTLAAL